MTKNSMGLALLTISLATLGWYFLCPIVAVSGTTRWKTLHPNEEPGHHFKYAQASAFILTRSQYHFWPGVAIIWPSVLGAFLLLGPGRENISTSDQT